MGKKKVKSVMRIMDVDFSNQDLMMLQDSVTLNLEAEKSKVPNPVPVQLFLKDDKGNMYGPANVYLNEADYIKLWGDSLKRKPKNKK